MFSSWFSSWAGARIRLADDLEVGREDEKASCWSNDHPESTKQAAGLGRVTAVLQLPRESLALTPTHQLPPKPPHVPLLDRSSAFLAFDLSTITLTPTPTDGHWLLCPPGSAPFWAWTMIRIALLLVRVGVCWVSLAMVEFMASL